jgi:hypothetical protein
MSQTPTVWSMLQRRLDSRVSIRQLVYLATTAGLLVGLPYVTVGLIWASTHNEHLNDLDGLDKLFSVLGEIVAWPVLIIANVDLR